MPHLVPPVVTAADAASRLLFFVLAGEQLAVDLRWLPSSGLEEIASGKAGLARALDIARHLVLPVTALGAIYMALYLRMMRAGMAAPL